MLCRILDAYREAPFGALRTAMGRSAEGCESQLWARGRPGPLVLESSSVDVLVRIGVRSSLVSLCIYLERPSKMVISQLRSRCT